MNRRERILLILVVGLGMLWAGKVLYGRYQQALDARQAAVEAAKDRLLEANAALAEAQEAVRKLEVWQNQSLPSDGEQARSLYRAWLSDTAKRAGVVVDDINPLPQTARSQAFRAIGYTIQASGSLKAVTAMLYEFYSKPLLHKITRLQLNRVPGASDLRIVMEVEALSLPRAVAVDNLPEGKSQRLALANLEEYQRIISERDLVTAYSPPPPPQKATTQRREPPAPPKFDDAEHAHFTGTVGPLSNLRAWINVRTTGETLHVGAGDEIKVGLFEGKVISVQPRALILKSGDKTIRVVLGQNLRSGKEIETDTAASNELPASRPES